MQNGKNVHGDFFLKINNHADQNKTVHTNTNKRAGGNFSSKSIIVQTKIRQCRVDFFLKINKRACTSIRYTRVYAHLGQHKVVMSKYCKFMEQNKIFTI